MQTISDTDLIYAKMRWNLSDLAVQRGDRVKRATKVRSARLSSLAIKPVPQFAPDEADMERVRLAHEAQSSGWSPAQLRAKQAWVTMRTIGWRAPSALRVGA
jgi:hypothetical protein